MVFELVSFIDHNILKRNIEEKLAIEKEHFVGSDQNLKLIDFS